MKNKSGNEKSSDVKREKDNDRCSWVGRLRVGDWGGHRHAQGGTHEEMPCPVILVVDGTARLLTEAGVSLCVVEVEVVEPKVFELVLGETQFPGNVGPPDGEGIVVSWGEGHGVVVK